jgi:F-type H+-transporting ATPase subunit b
MMAQFGDSGSSGISALGINVTSFLIQLATFIIAFLVLRKWAFKPILKVLNERREKIEKGVSLGEKMQKDEAEMEQKVAEALQKSRKESDKIISEASDRGRQIVSDAETKAKQKAEGIISTAEERTKQDLARARKQLESDMANLVSEATEVIIDEKIDPKKDASLIDKALKGQKV